MGSHGASYKLLNLYLSAVLTACWLRFVIIFTKASNYLQLTFLPLAYDLWVWVFWLKCDTELSWSLEHFLLLPQGMEPATSISSILKLFYFNTHLEALYCTLPLRHLQRCESGLKTGRSWVQVWKLGVVVPKKSTDGGT